MRPFGNLVTVCNELTDQPRAALIDGVVAMMIQGVEGRAQEDLGRRVLPFDIHLSENLY